MAAITGVLFPCLKRLKLIERLGLWRLLSYGRLWNIQSVVQIHAENNDLWPYILIRATCHPIRSGVDSCCTDQFGRHKTHVAALKTSLDGGDLTGCF
jgi:hypothetical protein